jgi:hypothetical protein
VVVTNPGTAEEAVWADFSTHLGALSELRTLRNADDDADIMKRRDDGTLTTEF